jgi:hypothetical protein
MPDWSRVEDLLLEWESAWRAGREVTPEELCPDWPEGQAELRRRAASLRKFEGAFALDEATTAEFAGRKAPPALPGYQIRGELGRGGMGVVYRAWQENLGREVAVKVMTGGSSQRFVQEARLLAQLKHDNLVPIYEAELHLGHPYFVMELIQGGNLAEAVGRFAGDPNGAVALVELVARVVHYAHEQGVLHRDLKPHNILLDEHGRPRVTDFGLAKLFGDDSQEADGSGPDTKRRQTLSFSGVPMGTPPYMAPEQFRGEAKAITRRTDVWALGVILYELLTGSRPFAPDRHGGYEEPVCESVPARPRSLRPKLDRGLEAIVLKCLEKDLTRRYTTAGALADDLARWRRGEGLEVRPESWSRRLFRRVRRRPIVTTIVALLAAAGFVWLVAASLTSYLTDPERVRERVRRDLTAGRPVTFVCDNGPPICYELAGWPTDTKTSTEPDRPFAVSTHSTALVQLWPEAPPAFRLRADIRHDHNSGDGFVGIYFDYRPLGSETTWPSCYIVRFTDRGPNAFRSRGPEGQPGSRVGITFHFFQPRPGQDPIEGYHIVNDGLFFVPPAVPPNPGTWRTIEVRVTPKLIEADWTNELGQAVRIARVEQRQFDQFAKMLPTIEPRMKEHSFNPGDGAAVGLYVRDSAAAFRNVVMEPLASTP